MTFHVTRVKARWWKAYVPATEGARARMFFAPSCREVVSKVTANLKVV